MQRGISKADRVLMVCSDTYVEKADAGRAGVAYERLIVTGELLLNIDTKKFLPIIRNNVGSQKVPVFLGPRLYIDFTRDMEYHARFEELLRELHGSPAATKPPLGPNPFSGVAPPGTSLARLVGPTGVAGSGVLLLDDPWFSGNEEAAAKGLAGLGFKGSMEVRFALHSPIMRSQLELLNAAQKSQVHTFGWPIGVVLDRRQEYRPKPVGDGIRAEISVPELAFTGRPSYDYWGLRSSGDFYLLQSLFEDYKASNVIFFNTRIVRVTEAFLFAANLYYSLGVPAETKVSFRVIHRGLAGRVLSSSNPARILFPNHAKSGEDVSQGEVVETLGAIREHLVDNVRRITEPLFMLFDFMKLDPSVYADIITRFAEGEST